MLEDNREDVLRKALTGNGSTVRELAIDAGVSQSVVEGILNGDTAEDAALRKVSQSLGLEPEAFVGLEKYEPHRLLLDTIKRVELPFGDYGVNIWLLETSGGLALIDTGCDEASLSFALSPLPKTPDIAWVTHGHHDHIGGFSCLVRKKVPTYGWQVDHANPVVPGEQRTFEACRVCIHDLSGHFTPAIGIEFLDFDRPVVAVGDAIFAGSMGKCASPESYRLAQENLIKVFKRMPDETIILPGHGPATTLGEERASNPFLAAKL